MGHHPGVGIAAFIGAPETFSGAGEHHSRQRRMLQDGARATRLRRDSLHLAPVHAGILALIDTTASGSDDVVGIAWINIDCEDVGIVDDSFLDRSPGLSAVV